MPIAYIALVIFAIIVNYDQVSDLAGNERLQDCLLQVAKHLFILLMLMSGWQTRFVHPFHLLLFISLHILFQSVCYYSASEGPGVQAR